MYILFHLVLFPKGINLQCLLSKTQRTFENFLDIHGKATKSGDFFPHLSELNKVMEKFCVNASLFTHFGEILFFHLFYSNTNGIFQPISNSWS